MVQVNKPNPYVIPGIPNPFPTRTLVLFELFDGKKTVDKILSIISRETGVPEPSIRGKSRKKEIVRARHLAYYFTTEHLASVHKLSDIHFWVTGKIMEQGHSTVIHGRDSVRDALNGDMRGPYADSIVDFVHLIDKSIKQLIDESNRTYWQSRQR